MSQAGGPGGAGGGPPSGREAERGLLGALAGTEADRACAVADRTRRVVATSIGVLEGQRAGRKRMRAVALAVLLMIPVLMVPFIWWAVEQLQSTGRLYDPASQLALWVCILCPALGAAALVAGWLRR